jgi:RNA polymerase sigma factor (sigma-70 family)
MITIDNASTIAGVGDVGELYGLLARRLEQIVRLDVHAPDVLIEDACQAAWIRLLHHRERVYHETVLGWLARTAVHEAFKLLRRTRREVPLEAADEDTAHAGLESVITLAEVIEHRERLAALGCLPERQQRAVWLHALGLSYAEIGRHEGCTVRTVDRQLLRARERIREGLQPG